MKAKPSNRINSPIFLWVALLLDTGPAINLNASAPSVETLPAASLTADGATLQGEVNPNGVGTFAWFEWGTTTNYGGVTSTTALGSATNPVPVSSTLTGLTVGVTCHFRIVATNSAGRVERGDQSFTPNLFTDLNAGLPAVNQNSVAWGDYDKDGDLDVLLTGWAGMPRNKYPITRVYRNNGDDTFTDIDAELPGVGDYYSITYRGSAAAWGDYDNDGDLDILLSGSTNLRKMFHVCRNNGMGSFSNLNAGFPGVANSAVAWGDYDNDGDLDILLTGGGPSGVYRNNRDDTFTNIEAGLPGFHDSSVAWGDYDNDGDLDILFTGSGSSSRIYRNNRDDTFTNIEAGLPGIEDGSAAWGDCDGDGDLDILLTGSSDSGRISHIYRNNGDGTFSNLNADLPGVSSSSVAWGDYDNDGDLDFLLAGYNGSTLISHVYRNDGDGSFTGIDAGLPGVSSGSMAFGDFDNDGDLDVLLTGRTSDSETISAIYRNNSLVANTSPTAPTGLTAAILGLGVELSWNAATDAQTINVNGFTYNLRVGTTPGGLDIVSPQADVHTGLRRLPEFGNAQHGVVATLTNLTALTTYYWSVQAIDTAFAGSPFATEQSFTTPATQPTVSVPDVTGDSSIGVTINSTVNPNGLATTAWFEWGTTTNFGHSTAATNVGSATAALPVSSTLTGLTVGVTYYFRLVATNSEGWVESNDQSFTPPLFSEVNAGLQELVSGRAAWGDYDNDDDLDILFSGRTESIYEHISCIYRNNGDETFTNIHAGLPGLFGSAAWGDYDNDTDLDVLLTGSDGDDYFSRICRNNGDETFTVIGAELQEEYRAPSSITWGDFDNDGDLDVLVLESLDSVYPQHWVSRIYRNNGDGTFSTMARLPALMGGALACGDYDNDGDLDILLTGDTSSDSGYPWPIFGILGGEDIDDIGVVHGSAAWGDYDNDGDLDILLSGQGWDFDDDWYEWNAFGWISRVYRNDGDGTFTNIEAGLPGGFLVSVAWGDYDNDGDLDILLTPSGSSYSISLIFQNNGDDTFTRIEAGLPGGRSAAWGDYDNDGDLDLLFTGSGNSNGSCIYRNNGLVSNTPPAAPSSLIATTMGTGVGLSWDAATDAQTPALGLTYNLRVGTTPGGSDVVSPHANLATGYRRLAQLGNAQHGLTAFLTNLQPGATYYWCVQAVDTAFAGGPFSAETSFTIIDPQFLTITAQSGPAFLLEGRGAPGMTYTLQTSTNLLDWATRTNLTAGPDCFFQYLDTPDPTWPACFYRLVEAKAE